jgi:Flp pilus assembly protein TadG
MLKTIARKAAGHCKRYRKSTGGAAAVEFALVAFPFFYVLGAICETGLMLFTEYVIQNAVQESARAVRTGQVSTTSGTATKTDAEFKDDICENLSTLIDCDGELTVYVNNAADFAALEGSIEDPINIGKKSDGTYSDIVFSPGGQKVAATVIATYDWDFAFPFMDFLGNVFDGEKRRIYGIAIFRNEPF